MTRSQRRVTRKRYTRKITSIDPMTRETITETARMLSEIRAAVVRGDLTARRGERDRLTGATLALQSLLSPSAGAGTESHG